MIELRKDTLAFSFPEVHPEARLEINFQRTLRIPDDGRDYPLPAGLGKFPMVHVDDHAARLPEDWIRRGGVMVPMWQAEAMWISFSPSHVTNRAAYPFAIKIAAGKINAVTGKAWQDKLVENPQDYVVAPGQPWLDGFCVERGVIRQFVAMPLGQGYTVEEQITGEAEFGGLQIVVYPMRREVFERRFPERKETFRERLRDAAGDYAPICMDIAGGMGMGMGGRMRQEISEDEFDFSDWDHGTSSRCFVHLMNSQGWEAVTGKQPPTRPPTAKEYEAQGIPWFSYYNDSTKPVNGSSILRGLKSVFAHGKAKGESPLPDEESIAPGKVVELRAGLAKDQVREGRF